MGVYKKRNHCLDGVKVLLCVCVSVCVYVPHNDQLGRTDFPHNVSLVRIGVYVDLLTVRVSLKAHCTFNMQVSRWLNYYVTTFLRPNKLFDSFIMKLLHVSIS